MVRAQPRHDIGVMSKPDGEFTTSTTEALDLVMDNAFPESEAVPPHHSNMIRLQNLTEESFTYPEYNWMDLDTIRASFLKFKNSKSPGPDKFKPRMLKQLPDIALHCLKQLYEASFFSGYVPEEWLKSSMVFLSKPGKANYSLPSSFRPICLTSVVFKAMERLVYWNLLETSLKERPMSPRQHGFRKGMSTDTALSMTLGKIKRGMLRKKGISVAVFLRH